MPPSVRKRSKGKRGLDEGANAEDAASRKQILEDINATCAALVQQVDPEITSSHGSALRQAGVVVGVNAVTRAFKTGELGLILVCQETKPRLLTEHLSKAAAHASVPLAYFSGPDGSGSLDLGAALGVRTAIAVGFQTTRTDGGKASNSDSLLGDLVQRLKSSMVVHNDE